MATRFTYYDNRGRSQPAQRYPNRAPRVNEPAGGGNDEAARNMNRGGQHARGCGCDCGCGSGCECHSGHECGCGCNCNCGCECGARARGVEICETMTLHESFDPCAVCANSATIAYDTSFLGYTVEQERVNVTLPFGGNVCVNVAKVSLTGAIPYIINVGPICSSCGSPVTCSLQGSTMVDEVIGYVCEGNDPGLCDISCSNVIPSLEVQVEKCGAGKSNIVVRGMFNFVNLPELM